MPYLLELTYLGTIFAASVIIGALTLRSWAWRGAGGSQSLVWLMLAFTFSTVCYLFIALMEAPELVFFWAKLRHLGLALMPVFFLRFVFEFTGEREWLATRRAALLFIVPLGMQLVIWTSPTPGLFFQSWRAHRESILSIEQATYGDAWRIYVSYTYLLYGIGLFLLGSYARRVTGLRRVQALGLMLGSLVAGSLTVVQVLGLAPGNVPNVTPLGYALSSSLFYITLFRYRLVDLMPIANDIIFQHMKDPVFVLNNEMRVVAINPIARKLVRHSEPDPLIGRTALEIFSHTPNILLHTADLSHKNTEVVFEVDGHPRTYDLRLSAIYQHQRVIGRLIVLRDVTEQRLANARRLELLLEREKSRLLSSFIQYTSHDLRTPLTKMNLALHLLRVIDDGEKREDKIREVEREIRNITNIIEELHLLTRLESGMSTEGETFPLSCIVNDIPSDLRTLIESKQLTVSRHVDETLQIWGDLTLLRHAFHHVLRNAAMYTPDDGAIEVLAWEDDTRFCVLEIRDTGVGIDTAHLNAIFDHFFKVNTARTADGSGAGLGLAIVKKVMEMHSGSVSVQSTLGEGSTFQLRIPVDRPS